MRMICGKYDSLWKKEYNVRTGKFTGRLERGTFATAMDYARRVKGGMGAIEYARYQPWETWKANKKG